MAGKKKNYISPISILVITVTAVISFYMGTQYQNRISENTPTAEAARKNVFESYADCTNLKKDPTDTIPPTIDIIKPTQGELIPNITSSNDVVWVDMRATDDKTNVYPALYVNDVFELASVNMVGSYDDPTIRRGYFHVRPNKSYTLKAKACDDGGNEAWSSPVTFTTSR